VNDVWGGDGLGEWGVPFWQLSGQKGFALLDRVLHSHFFTSRHALPLMLAHDGGLVVEITDGDFLGYRGSLFYDLAKLVPMRLAFALMAELATHGKQGVTSCGRHPGLLALSYCSTRDSWTGHAAWPRRWAWQSRIRIPADPSP